MCEMCETLVKPLDTQKSENERAGVLLGYWDQEKTTNIVGDLENSVSIIERKCKKLLQELVYYQYYTDELSNINVSKALPEYTKVKNKKTGYLKSTSVPDIAFRKSIIATRGFERSFHDAFEKKLASINRALSDASRKIGLNENLFLFPMDDYVKTLEENALASVEKYLAKIQDEFFKSYLKRTVKSDLTLTKAENEKINPNISQITKNQLDFYKKLSKVNLLKKNKYKKLIRTKMIASPVGRTNLVKLRKIRYKKVKGQGTRRFKSAKPRVIMMSKKNSFTNLCASNTSNSDKFIKSKTKPTKIARKKNVSLNKKSSSNSQSLNSSTLSSTSNHKSETSIQKSSKNDVDIDTLCYNLVTALRNRHPIREQRKHVDNDETENKIRSKANLMSLAKKAIPFTTCKSTTRSHNIKMNVQQYISIKKQRPVNKLRNDLNMVAAHRSHSPVGEQSKQAMMLEVPKLEEFSEHHVQKPLQTNSVNAQYMVTTYPWSPKESSERQNKADENNSSVYNKMDVDEKICTFSKTRRFQGHEINHVERKDVWISKRCTNNVDRKFRSRYTKTTPESFIRYHKSTTKQYANGQESMIKSESKTAYAVGSNIMVSDCQRTDFYGIKKSNHCNNAYGDNSFNIDCEALKEDWSKIFALFSNLSKKYTMLKETSTMNGQPSDAVLKTFEIEIDNAIEKYKEFLRCYSKFLQLKQQLKSMRIACDAQSGYNDSSVIFSASYQKKTNHKKPTYSMVLKETLRKVQDLQDRIRVTDEV